MLRVIQQIRRQIQAWAFDRPRTQLFSVNVFLNDPLKKIFVQVPGRLGLLITLYLIATNVYNSINAPSQRGFSYIEIWMIGIQFPMLVGIIEYGILLAMKKYHQFEYYCCCTRRRLQQMDNLAIVACIGFSKV